MSNFALSLGSLKGLSPPLSGGAVHRFINRGPNPIVLRSPIGSTVYPVFIGHRRGPHGRHLIIEAPDPGPDLNYDFAWTDSTNWRVDETDEEDIYWSDQLV